MIDHRRDDLDYLPCDQELPAPPGASPAWRVAAEAPAVAERGAFHQCGCSAYLCEVCNPRRPYLTAALQVSLARAKPEPEVKCSVVVLASWRGM